LKKRRNTQDSESRSRDRRIAKWLNWLCDNGSLLDRR
jgi:hypothetical protein